MACLWEILQSRNDNWAVWLMEFLNVHWISTIVTMIMLGEKQPHHAACVYCTWMTIFLTWHHLHNHNQKQGVCFRGRKCQKKEEKTEFTTLDGSKDLKASWCLQKSQLLNVSLYHIAIHAQIIPCSCCFELGLVMLPRLAWIVWAQASLKVLRPKACDTVPGPSSWEGVSWHLSMWNASSKHLTRERELSCLLVFGRRGLII